jgi:hypothetical protein
MKTQLTDTVLMIRPVRFAYNEQTAASNAFQKNIISADTNTEAQKLFDRFVDILKLHDVKVVVVNDSLEPHKPDSIFPNNWFSTHHSGKIILYPMEAENRRFERRKDLLEMLQKDFEVNEIIDISDFENQSQYLEGTGSLILDRINKIAYACISSRTNKKVLDQWSKLMNYRIVSFDSKDKSGKEIYHTNVMMCLGDRYAVICLDSIPDIHEKQNVIKNLESSGKIIIEISQEQVLEFAGNMLQIQSKKGHKLLVMSEKAYKSLNSKQIRILEEYNQILAIDLGIIETLGGGSARCMLAEIHLDKKL